MSFDYSVCLICYDLIMKREICCGILRFIQCADCFHKLLRQNRGIHICPQCRHTFDRRSGKIDDNTLTIDWKSDSDSDSDYDPDDHHSYLLRILESSGAQLHLSPFQRLEN